MTDTGDRIRLYDRDRLVVHDTIDTGMQFLTRCGRRASWLGTQWQSYMEPTENPVDCPECVGVLDEAAEYQAKREGASAMDKWVRFARARLDEMEARIQDDRLNNQVAHTLECAGWMSVGRWEPECLCSVPDYTLADIAAKRKIIDACVMALVYAEETNRLAETAVMAICEPFASHPEYPGERQ